MKILTFILFLFTCINLYAQESNAYLHLQGSIFSSGESVSGALLFDTKAVDNKVFKVNIQDINGSKIESFFIRAKENSAHFSFDLPYTSPSGYIMILVETLDKNNQPLFVIGSSVFCINNTDEIIKDSYPKPSFENKSFTLKYVRNDFISNNKNTFDVKASRDYLTFTIVDKYYQKNPNLVASKKTFTIIEIENWVKKIYSSFNLLNNSKPYQTNILGLYSNYDDTFILSKSEASGKSIYLYDDFENEKYFQAAPYSKEILNLSIEPNEASNDNYIISNQTFTTEEKAVLENYKQRTNINQYFYSASFSEKANVEKRLQTIEPQKKYVPANYKKFELFHEFCKENNLYLNFSKGDKEYKASIDIPSNFAKKFNVTAENPIFLINGYYTKNYSKIAMLKTDEINSFELYYDLDALRKAYSVFGSETIVKVNTKTALDLRSDQEKNVSFSLYGFKKNKNISQSKVLERKNNIHHPIFEPYLYWYDKDKLQSQIEKSGDKSQFIALYSFFLDNSNKIVFVESDL